MNSDLLLENVLLWSAQVTILALAAAVASIALRQPRARFHFWQAILIAALLLPVAAPWKQPAAIALNFPATVATPAPATALPVSSAPLWQIEPVFALLAAGVLARLLWIAGGLLRLRQIRRKAEQIAELSYDAPVSFAASARWYYSDDVSSPVTFGWLRPAILLPTHVRDLPAEVQEAITSHELLHVQRRDWLFVMAEELVRSLLWFHPAIWLVLGRIQLSREEVVDRAVVEATGDRTGYLNALMTIAAKKLQPDVAPAPLFLKKRQLAVRVQALLKESTRSASRLAAHVSAAASLAVIGAVAAVWFFPLRSAAQVVPDDPGITVQAGAPLAHRPPVRNPGGTTGDVLLELTLNSKGEVADARVLSGPQELRKSALASALEWHYLAATAPPSLVHATIHFGERSAALAAAPPPPPPPPPPGRAKGGTGARIGTGPPPPPPPPPPPDSGIVRGIESLGLSPDLQQRVQNILTVHEGDTLKLADWNRIRELLQGIDEHLVFTVLGSGTSDPQRAGIVLRIMLAGNAAQPSPPATGAFNAPVPIQKREPEYTPEARQAGLQGAVLLRVMIDETGVPQDIQVVRSLGLGLDQKAIEAVKNWRFKPGTTKYGQPVRVAANIEISFRL